MSEAVDDVSAIGDLVQALTENENLELKSETMCKIREICRMKSYAISHVYHSLMTQLHKEHAEIRYIMVLAINDLFLRSSLFRNLVESNLEEFLELTLETNYAKLLPPPRGVATRLKLKMQHFLKDWDLKFGDKCKKINNAFTFLKNTGKIENETNDSRPSDNSRRLENRLSFKISQIKQDMENMGHEIHDVINQIENCFQLLLPLPSDVFESGLQDDCPDEESTIEKDHLRHHGIYDVKTSLSISVSDVKTPTVMKNSNNMQILENLNDLYNKISQTYLPLVSKWLKVLSKDRNSTNAVKKAIDLKQLLDAKVSKYQEINVQSKPASMTNSDTESDSDFEDVEEKEGFEVTAMNVDETTVEKPKPSIRMCRAILPSGRLCPRQDKHKCPFHGVIIDRTEHGIAVCDLNQPSTSQQAVGQDWQDPELLQDIRIATGIDLSLPIKGKRKQTKKYSARTNVKNIKNTTYNRLFKKVFKKEARKKKR